MAFFFSLILLVGVSFAAELEIPALTSPVMDQAGLLSETERKDLSDLAYEIYTHQGPQITILTVNDLQDYPIEEFSIRVAEKWKLGLKEKGNGLLITVAKTERKVRIEVGEGIEGEITDYESHQYISQVLTPYFKEGQFYNGLRLVLEDVAKKFSIQLSGNGQQVLRRAPVRVNNRLLHGALPIVVIFLLVGQLILRKKPVARGLFSGAGIAGASFFLLPGLGLALIGILFLGGFALGAIGLNNLLFALASGSHHRGGSGGGGFGAGGSWGGGGGGFSGGGSSGSW